MIYSNTDHITNASAIAFIKGLRREFSGLTKIYGSRYMNKLEVVNGYLGGVEVEDVKVADESRKSGFKTVFRSSYILNISDVRKEFKNAKAAGEYMEKTISDKFDFGILSL